MLGCGTIDEVLNMRQNEASVKGGTMRFPDENGDSKEVNDSQRLTL